MLIEKIQLEAGRILVTGTTKMVGIDKLYKELGWLKLSERRRLHKLFQFFQNGERLNSSLPDILNSPPCW